NTPAQNRIDEIKLVDVDLVTGAGDCMIADQGALAALRAHLQREAPSAWSRLDDRAMGKNRHLAFDTLAQPPGPMRTQMAPDKGQAPAIGNKVQEQWEVLQDPILQSWAEPALRPA